MEYNVENIKKYYNDSRIYDYNDLIKRGFLDSDAFFLNEIGVPYNF